MIEIDNTSRIFFVDFENVKISGLDGLLELNSTDDDIVKLAIEFCESTGVSSHTIGWNKDMLNDGSWQTDPQPHLPESKNNYEVRYRIGFFFKGFKFLGELLNKDNESVSSILQRK